MSKAIQEENILALWVIAALLAFGFGYSVWGWIFAVKAATDLLAVLFYAYIEAEARINRAQADTKKIAKEA